MRRLGLIGGTSWVSTAEYYRLINEGVHARLGGTHFAECVIHSFDYADIMKHTLVKDWDGVLELVAGAARGLKAAGAEGLVLCANTMHVIADRLGPMVGLPIVHIMDATADAIAAQRLGRVALLGTRFTMEMDFVRGRLAARGIEVAIPDEDDREFIQGTIFGELGRGEIVPATKGRYLDIIARLVEGGAEGVILGCTEIPLLLAQPDVPVPAFDTTALHAAAAVRFALGEEAA